MSRLMIGEKSSGHKDLTLPYVHILFTTSSCGHTVSHHQQAPHLPPRGACARKSSQARL